MKRLLILLAIALLTLPALAQDNGHPRFSPEAFQARMEQYITEKASLTPQEAKKVFPILQQMREKQRQLNRQVQQLKRKQPAPNTSEAKYRKIIEKICDLTEEQADIEGDYYEKMCKSVSPRKVYAVMLAEDAFHREMLQHFAPRGGGQGRGGRQRK